MRDRRDPLGVYLHADLMADQARRLRLQCHRLRGDRLRGNERSEQAGMRRVRPVLRCAGGACTDLQQLRKALRFSKCVTALEQQQQRPGVERAAGVDAGVFARGQLCERTAIARNAQTFAQARNGRRLRSAQQ